MLGGRKKLAETPVYHYDVRLKWFPDEQGMAGYELGQKITEQRLCGPYTLQGIEFFLGKGATVRFKYSVTDPTLSGQPSFEDVAGEGIKQVIREVMPGLMED